MAFSGIEESWLQDLLNLLMSGNLPLVTVSYDNCAFTLFKVFMLKEKLLSNIFYLIVRSISHDSSFHSGTAALFINTVDKAACFG